MEVPLFVFPPLHPPKPPFRPALWPAEPYGIFNGINMDSRGSEKGHIRMRRILLTAVAAGLLPIVATLADQSDAGRGYKSFQLVYQSDTRGYYRPCG